MLRNSACFLVALTLLSLVVPYPALGDEPLFSGPQAGESLPPFKIRGVFDDLAGVDYDLVGKAAGKPIVLIFFHERTRPAFGLTNAIMRYAAGRSNDGLAAGIVFLTGDPTETQQWLKVVRRHLPAGVQIGISPEGIEGPGSYGLNRNVALTVLVGKDHKVTANFALVQPSMQADGPKIAQAIVDVLGGGKAPTAEELSVTRMSDTRPAIRPATAEASGDLRSLLGPVIRKEATPEEVERAAEKVEQVLAKDRSLRRQIGQIGARIIKSGKLDNYGTPKAREYLLKWARQYGGDEEKK